MNSYIKQINLNGHQPVSMQLWNGNFEVRTHPELSVKIIYNGIKNAALVPQVIQQASGIQIRNQSITSLFVRSDAVKIIIYVPDETTLNIQQFVGGLSVTGSYTSVKARLWSGNIYSDMDTLFIKEESQIRLISGNIFIDNDDSSNIRSRAGDDSFQQYRFYNKARFSAISHLGIVSRKSGIQERGICVG